MISKDRIVKFKGDIEDKSWYIYDDRFEFFVLTDEIKNSSYKNGGPARLFMRLIHKYVTGA
jgi:hypothetical protein